MSLKKYTIPFVTAISVLLFCYLFTNVLVYILISMVIALLGMPIVNFLSQLKFGPVKISQAISAVVTLFFFFVIIYFFGRLFLPPLITQITFLSKTNYRDVLFNVLNQYPEIKNMILAFGSEQEIISALNNQLNTLINIDNLSLVLDNTLSYLGSILGGVFSVLFISFFFLKDEKIVVKAMFIITPTDYEMQMKEIIRTSKKMLSKYFTGLFIDVALVSSLVTILMLLFGVKNALVIGLLAGVLNVIPYIGPIITMIFALFLGVSGCIELGEYANMTLVLTKIFFILISVNIIDAMLIQPLIFSNTVKAHPLEIFLVILMAGALGGIIGMVIAIPSYTLIRIIAKEFLQQFKFFQNISKNIPDSQI
jgi:predicted PurR-regulated permease PerM